jgi:hypothetical protein
MKTFAVWVAEPQEAWSRLHVGFVSGAITLNHPYRPDVSSSSSKPMAFLVCDLMAIKIELCNRSNRTEVGLVGGGAVPGPSHSGDFIS